MIGLIALSLIIAAVFGWYFWKHYCEKRRARRASDYCAQMRQKGLSPAPWNLFTTSNKPPGLVISSPRPTSTVRSPTVSSVGSRPVMRDRGPLRLGEMIFERTFDNTPSMPMPPTVLPPPPPPIRPRRPSAVTSIQRSDSIVYLEGLSDTDSVYSLDSQEHRLIPDKEEYYDSECCSRMTSSSQSPTTSQVLDDLLHQLQQPLSPTPERSNNSHLLVLRSDREQQRQPSLRTQPGLRTQPNLNIRPRLKNQPGFGNHPNLNIRPSLRSLPRLGNHPNLNIRPSLRNQPNVRTQPDLVSQPSVKRPPYGFC